MWCKSDRLNPQCIQSTVKHGGDSLMVFGCFSKFGVGTLVLIDGRVTGATHVNILSENLTNKCVKNGYGFQQDDFIEKLNWPAQSPGLNLFMHFGSI